MPRTTKHQASTSTNYVIADSHGKFKGQILTDPLGYQYSAGRKNKSTTYWKCVVRPKNRPCPATVAQSGQEFIPGKLAHNHKDKAGGHSKQGGFINILKNAIVDSVSPIDTQTVRGVTVLDGELFVAFWYLLKVFDKVTMKQTRKLELGPGPSIKDLVAVTANKMLYAVDGIYKKIYKIHPQKSVAAAFVIDVDSLNSLAVTSSNTLLVTSVSAECFYEYSVEGDRLKSIKLDKGLYWMGHIVELPGDLFAACHGSGKAGLKDRLVMLNKEGRIVKTFGDNAGKSVRRFKRPTKIAVASEGMLLVLDTDNKRIRVFNFNLEFIGNVHLNNFEFADPQFIHLDEASRRLFIGEYSEKRLIVLTY